METPQSSTKATAEEKGKKISIEEQKQKKLKPTPDQIVLEIERRSTQGVSLVTEAEKPTPISIPTQILTKPTLTPTIIYHRRQSKYKKNKHLTKILKQTKILSILDLEHILHYRLSALPKLSSDQDLIRDVISIVTDQDPPRTRSPTPAPVVATTASNMETTTEHNNILHIVDPHTSAVEDELTNFLDSRYPALDM